MQIFSFSATLMSSLKCQNFQVIEPSNCTFQLLMDGIQELTSDISNDQEFFNRMFPWWHRIPRHMNYLKYFWTRQANEVDNMNR
jgi:hypothetical protein